MKKILFTIVILLVTSTAYAQSPPPATGGNKIGWDQSAPTLAEAQGYIYKYYPDASPSGTTLTSVTCTGDASPFKCEVAFPAFTPGNHTLALTAGNAAGESIKSSILSFTFIVIPGAPSNLVIK